MFLFRNFSGKNATLISTMEDEIKGHLAVVHRLVKNVYYITGNFLLHIKSRVIFLKNITSCHSSKKNSHHFFLGSEEADNKTFQMQIGASAAVPHNEPKTKTCTFAIRNKQILLKRVIQESD